MLLGRHGAFHTHPMYVDGSVECFASFNNQNCPSGFLYFNQEVGLVKGCSSLRGSIGRGTFLGGSPSGRGTSLGGSLSGIITTLLLTCPSAVSAAVMGSVASPSDTSAHSYAPPTFPSLSSSHFLLPLLPFLPPPLLCSTSSVCHVRVRCGSVCSLRTWPTTTTGQCTRYPSRPHHTSSPITPLQR